MPNACAVVMTYGRAALGELLASYQLQTERLPLLVWVDARPELRIEAPPGVHVVHGMREPGDSIGSRRARAIGAARELFGLDDLSAVLVLDDDDWYHPRHFELTLRALEGALWTCAHVYGYQAPGELVRRIEARDGPGQHATWAYRLTLYDWAGGYRDDNPSEDRALARRMGVERCRPHRHCTHVRRDSAAQLTRVGWARRDELPELDATARDYIAPSCSAEWLRLFDWTERELQGLP